MLCRDVVIGSWWQISYEKVRVRHTPLSSKQKKIKVDKGTIQSQRPGHRTRPKSSTKRSCFWRARGFVNPSAGISFVGIHETEISSLHAFSKPVLMHVDVPELCGCDWAFFSHYTSRHLVVNVENLFPNQKHCILRTSLEKATIVQQFPNCTCIQIFCNMESPPLEKVCTTLIG